MTSWPRRARNRFQLPILLLPLLAVLPASPAPAEAAGPVPDVPFVLLRLDFSTLEMRKAYRFVQPYRKSLAPEGFQQIADLFIDFEAPSDFGHTEIRSRLTGRTIYRATTIWMGEGVLEWPTDAQAVAGLTRGSPAPDPNDFRWTSFNLNVTEARARAVWDSLRDLDLVNAIAQEGAFGVFVFDHMYATGGSTGPLDMNVLVYGHPRAPKDAGIERVVWPRSLVTLGVRCAPQVRVHNFSDDPLDVEIEVEIRTGQDVSYRSVEALEGLAADSSRSVSFDKFLPYGQPPFVLQARLRAHGGGDWVDAFPDDDLAQRDLAVVALPVFRPVSSYKEPGPIPLGGEILDFDGDGDLDVIQLGGFLPVFWRNEGDGRFVDITSQVHATFHQYVRRALARDFTGDGVPDVILVYYARYPILLRGSGDGTFEEITLQAGLTAYTATAGLEALDMDGDGDQDLVLQGSGETVLLNDGAGHFTDHTASSGLNDDSTTATWIASGPIDADPSADIIMVNWSLPSVIYQNLGGGTFQRTASLGAEKWSRMAAIFDYDHDGAQDILLARNYGSRLFRHLGSLLFEEATSAAGDIGSSFFTDAGDIDQDGWTDLVQQGTPWLALNQGGVFRDHSELLADMDELAASGFWFGLSNPLLRDIDDDGDLDIYSRNIVFENQGLARQVIEVGVDMRSGKIPGAILGRARGVIPVAILGSESFNVRDVVPATIVLGPGRAHLARIQGPRFEDVNKDGRLDLVAHFLAGETGLSPGDTEACLDGETAQGSPFRGCDTLGAAPRRSVRRR